MKLHSCETCRIRAYAERKPDSIIGRIWRWHSGWCPWWKAEQRKLAGDNEPGSSPEAGGPDGGVGQSTGPDRAD